MFFNFFQKNPSQNKELSHQASLVYCFDFPGAAFLNEAISH